MKRILQNFEEEIFKSFIKVETDISSDSIIVNIHFHLLFFQQKNLQTKEEQFFD